MDMNEEFTRKVCLTLAISVVLGLLLALLSGIMLVGSDTSYLNSGQNAVLSEEFYGLPFNFMTHQTFCTIFLAHITWTQDVLFNFQNLLGDWIIFSSAAVVVLLCVYYHNRLAPKIEDCKGQGL